MSARAEERGRGGRRTAHHECVQHEVAWHDERQPQRREHLLAWGVCVCRRRSRRDVSGERAGVKGQRARRGACVGGTSRKAAAVLRAARVRTGVGVDDRLLDLARRVQLVRCGAAAAFFFALARKAPLTSEPHAHARGTTRTPLSCAFTVCTRRSAGRTHPPLRRCTRSDHAAYACPRSACVCAPAPLRPAPHRW
jgi:hypothetical protein